MPSGVYRRTEYHQKIISDGVKRFIRENPEKSGHFKKGHIPWNTNLILGPYSDVRKENIRISHIGLRYPNRKKYSQQTIENIAKSIQRKWEDQIYREKLSGKNSHFWKGGSMSFKDYGKEFNKHLRTLIRIRDQYICQDCKIKENNRRFSIHHIDLNKKNNDPNNLILLCSKCHQKEHIRIRKVQGYYSNLKRGSETIIRTPEMVKV